ncbi:16S rRNA processing protein RimM [bacterium]|nr:16S rRNA processing protein RimM [bacterium]
MSAPTADRLIVVAQIVGAQGVRGEVRIRSYTADPAACLDYGPLKDEDGKVVLTPASWRPVKDGFVVTPVETVAREAWEAARGQRLHVSRDALPDVDEDEVYVEDLIGCRVVDRTGAQVGVVKAVHNFGADDLIEVARADGSVRHVPFTKAMVPGVDMERRELIIDPPPELLDW